MPFLTIAGTTYPVLIDGASEVEPAFGGIEEDWSWDGTPRFAYSEERRAREFSLGHMSQASYDTLRNAVSTGIVSVGGDAYGTAKNCLVRITSCPYVDNGALGFYRQPNVEAINTES